MDVNIRILRFNPEEDQGPHLEDYIVTADPMDRLLDCLHMIKWSLDSSLALRRSCGHGVCGSDAMVVNGVTMLACKVLVKDQKQPITVEPIRGLSPLRDLIVDMEPFFAGYRAVMPWLIPADVRVDSESEQLVGVVAGRTYPHSCVRLSQRRAPRAATRPTDGCEESETVSLKRGRHCRVHFCVSFGRLTCPNRRTVTTGVA